MKSRHLYRLGGVALVAFAQILSCSGPSNNATEPETAAVNMNGSVILPDYVALGYDDLTVGLGDHEEAIGNDGTFAIDANEHTPGLAMVRDVSGNVILMAIVPDPTAQAEFSIDVRSTAIALAFLHPFVCTSDPEHASDVLSTLDALDEMDDLEYLLEDEFLYTDLALSYESESLTDALTEVVMAYVNSYPDLTTSSLGKYAWRAPSKPDDYDGMQIDPDWEVSGLELNWKGGDQFEISNRFGRWAYCKTPSSSFLIYPNGDFLDLIKDGKPWQPSKRTFTMDVAANADTAYVRVYGYGFAPWDETDWNSLSAEEKRYVHTGGIATVAVELAANMASVITNSAKLRGREDIADRIGETVIGMLLSDGAVYAQISAYVNDRDPWGLSWFLAKHILGEVTNNPSFRAVFASATGLALTDGVISKLASWVAIPIKAVLIYNSVTSVLKTVMGLSTADLKTEFAVWQDVVKFGGVHGQVADHISGSPISGATVVLTGDENNPLNPTHERVTGSDGKYFFTDIGVGAKTLTATKSGYQEKSVTVTIAEDEDIEQHITMTRSGSGVSGRILNGVLVHHGIDPPTFQQDVEVVAYPIGISEDNQYLTVENGTYSLSLPSGTWRIRASHDGYYPDSIDVNVPESGGATPPRDLVLEPNPTIEGNIYIDMDNDGSYERDYYIVFEMTGLHAAAMETCPPGGQDAVTMMAGGMEGSTNYDVDLVEIGFKPSAIDGPGVYPCGSKPLFGCASSGVTATVSLLTGEEWCYDSTDGYGYMVFLFGGMSDAEICDCGITQPGNLYLTEWGEELGELVTGGVTVDLPGRANCSCSEGEHGWEIECAKAHLNLDFKLPVGTGYLAEPESAPVFSQGP
jgi:hypothetical protein